MYRKLLGLLLTLGVCVGFVAHADDVGVDFSKLEDGSKEPNLSDIYDTFLEYRRTVSYGQLTDEQKESLKKLEDYFKAVDVPATLQLKSTSGPEWQKRVEQVLQEKLKDEGLQEIAEAVQSEIESVYGYCGFIDPTSFVGDDVKEEIRYMVRVETDPKNYELRWNSLEEKSSGDVLAYLMFMTVPAEGYNITTNKRETCDFPRYVWALQSDSVHSRGFKFISATGFNRALMK